LVTVQMSWIARLSNSMQELKLVYPVKKPSGRSARRFLEAHYPQIKRLNPRLPFLVRSDEDADTVTLTARYDYGICAQRDLTNLTPQQCLEKLRELQELGAVALKADLYPWQESVPKNHDVVDYDRGHPDHHHL